MVHSCKEDCDCRAAYRRELRKNKMLGKVLVCSNNHPPVARKKGKCKVCGEE